MKKISSAHLWLIHLWTPPTDTNVSCDPLHILSLSFSLSWQITDQSWKDDDIHRKTKILMTSKLDPLQQCPKVEEYKVNQVATLALTAYIERVYMCITIWRIMHIYIGLDRILKVLSSEIDPAEIRLIRWIFIKGTVVSRRFFGKSAHPPIFPFNGSW